MAIDRATRQRFEGALPKDFAGSPLWQLLAKPDDPGGMGEYVYFIPVWVGNGEKYITNKRITIRSSVGRDGLFSDTNQNSIRMWVEYYWAKKDEWFALGKGDTGVYTTRVKGWEKRMTDKLRALYKLALDDERGRSSEGVLEFAQPEKSTDKATEPVLSPAAQHVWKSGELVWTCVKCGTGLPIADYPDVDSLPDGPCDRDEQCKQAQVEKDAILDKAKPQRRTRRVEEVESPESEPDATADKARSAFSNQRKRDAQPSRPEAERTPNPEQKAAILSAVDKPARVLAPPGSGKTYVMELRNVHLIREGVNPASIVNVTFNKNMAKSGRTRTLNTLRFEFPEMDFNEFGRWFCTIHALCVRMLREEGDSREVLGPGLIKRVIQFLAEKYWTQVDERPGWEEVYRFINWAKHQGLSSADDLEFFKTVAGGYHGRILHNVRRDFDNLLAGSRRYELDDWLKGKLGSTIYMTYGDMLLDVELRLKRDAQFRERWQSRFAVMNVDEGQDTTAQAMRILRTLAEPQRQFYIVGDTDQLLYRFAGATPEANLYEGFEECYQDGVTYKLVINYRSTMAIIKACNSLIACNYADKGGPYKEAYRKEIVPRPDAPDGRPVTFQMHADPHAEAAATVELIQSLMTEEYKEPGDFFVGARTKAQLGYIEGPLVRAGIPFINASGGSFWKSKHIQDIVAYIRLAHDPTDGVAFKRAYNVASNYMTVPWRNAKNYGEYCTTRYLSNAFLAKCDNDYRNVHQAAEHRTSWEPGVDDMTGLMADVKSSLESDGVAAAMEAVLDLCYAKYLKHDEGMTGADEAEGGKIEDIRTAIDVAGQFDTVEAFLTHVDDMIQAAEAAANKDWDGYLVISTVHGLKGQERPVVIGLGLVEFVEEDDPPNNTPGGLLPHTFSMMEPPSNGVLPSAGMGLVPDERDICYVLGSRAMELLFLSGPGIYRGRHCVPSRFIYEMGLLDSQEVSDVSLDDAEADASSS